MAWTHLERIKSYEVIVGPMKGNRRIGTPRIMMLDDIKADKTHEKTASSHG